MDEETNPRLSPAIIVCIIGDSHKSCTHTAEASLWEEQWSWRVSARKQPGLTLGGATPNSVGHWEEGFPRLSGTTESHSYPLSDIADPSRIWLQHSGATRSCKSLLFHLPHCSFSFCVWQATPHLMSQRSGKETPRYWRSQNTSPACQSLAPSAWQLESAWSARARDDAPRPALCVMWRPALTPRPSQFCWRWPEQPPSMNWWPTTRPRG